MDDFSPISHVSDDFDDWQGQAPAPFIGHLNELVSDADDDDGNNVGLVYRGVLRAATIAEAEAPRAVVKERGRFQALVWLRVWRVGVSGFGESLAGTAVLSVRVRDILADCQVCGGTFQVSGLRRQAAN